MPSLFAKNEENYARFSSKDRIPTPHGYWLSVIPPPLPPSKIVLNQQPCRRGGGAAKHRGCVRASHPAAPGSNLNASEIYTSDFSSVALPLRIVDGKSNPKKKLQKKFAVEKKSVMSGFYRKYLGQV